VLLRSCIVDGNRTVESNYKKLNFSIEKDIDSGCRWSESLSKDLKISLLFPVNKKRAFVKSWTAACMSRVAVHVSRT